MTGHKIQMNDHPGVNLPIGIAGAFIKLGKGIRFSYAEEKDTNRTAFLDYVSIGPK